ncbi:Spy/CpxP family protein refolding chaperone [Hydrogenophaga sp.]|jgi:protein CpxP|uniref:Spy/CpxP family protein refolding chaperone n=1 Tax=Hydrogenophaga sp. TaxID=1904254 RepID=UPI00271EEF6A|nr:Spy/CpxP family protein refolding chaperone [Hydrogenophaga sp.]MDO9250287.1 Spy/CpxP family protein refolding chaperone [Hydrogenophaga sp.]MDP3325280.1 Spy/CpxP family protein refolding chaperone [Hydrogenophaga sp.]MDP3885707.1 Spy/CpxP family protein refolding chaperone [Hydrogenophaga sp.]MDZ4360115.1 Spy/CpxP family protein refolding chaperone [Variovorax sp.]
MKLFSQRTLIAAALATAFVGVSATAIAQGMGHGPMSQDMRTQHMAQRGQAGTEAGPGTAEMSKNHAWRMERMQKRMAERQAQLKDTLKITPAQEAAWNAFVARTAPEPRMARSQSREDWAKLTTPERLDKMQALKAERDARMGKRIDATKSFYAALTPEQQKVFDTQRHGGFQRAGMQGERGMMGKHGHGGHHHRMGGMGGMGGGAGCDAPMQPNS